MNTKRRSTIPVLFYVAAAVVFLVGAAFLVTNIMGYTSTVSGYISQGYEASMVTKLMIRQVLLPGIFEPVGLYFGLAMVLFGIGKIICKLSACTQEACECCDCDSPPGDICICETENNESCCCVSTDDNTALIQGEDTIPEDTLSGLND